MIALENLVNALRIKGFYEIATDSKFKELSFYHYKKDEDIFVFLNESANIAYSDIVLLPLQEEALYYDAWKDCYETAECEVFDGYVKVRLQLEPAECCVLVGKKCRQCNTVHRPFEQQIGSECEVIDISDGWDVSMVKAKDYPQFSESIRVDTLKPISDDYPAFSGIIRYTKEIEFEEISKEVYLKAENVYEILKVTINEREAGIRITPPYQVSIGSFFKSGKNTIEIEVTTTPARDQMNYPHPPFDFMYEPVDATGMFGEVKLFIKKM